MDTNNTKKVELLKTLKDKLLSFAENFLWIRNVLSECLDEEKDRNIVLLVKGLSTAISSDVIIDKLNKFVDEENEKAKNKVIRKVIN